MSYSSFWINKTSTMARVSLCTVSILMSVNYRNNVSDILPKVKEFVWLQDFVNTILWFTIAAMAQYAVINYAYTET